MKGIIQADHALTKRLAICADPLTPWQNLRFIFRILELSFHGVPWLLFTFGAILRSDDMYHADNSVNLLAALILDLIVSLVVKLAVRRPRPAHHHSKDFLLTVKVDNQFSFPSGHTTRAIMCGCLLIYRIEMSLLSQLAIYVWSISTAISRVMLGRHYVTDVLAGSTIGFLQFFVLIQYLSIDETSCWNFARYCQSVLSGYDVDKYSHHNL